MLKHLARYIDISKNLKTKNTNLFQNANVGNFSCPIIIETLNPWNLLLFTFRNLISIHQEKLIIKHGQKSFQISHFKLYVVFKRRFMEVFSRYHLLVFKIVCFDNFKCIPCSCVPHNNRLFLVYLTNVPKHGRIGSWQVWQNVFNHHKIWGREQKNIRCIWDFCLEITIWEMKVQVTKRLGLWVRF
jgi:hypothetical protein